jgi:Ca-activated chloride channel family protein
MKNVLQLLIVLLFSTQINAQEKTITGTITSADDGLPLPGANIIVKNTARGSQADFNGKYSINANEGEILVFTFSGMVSTEKIVGSGNTIDVALKGNALDEVVIVGYRTRSMRSYSVSSVTLSSVIVENRPSRGFTQTLSGQVKGLKITSGSGQPGANSKVNLRGVASINENYKPLYIVNGKPVSESKFRSLKVKKIKHVEVLKRKEGADLYGNKGANGVIIIRTRGKKNNTDTSIINKFYEELQNDESYARIIENDFERTALSPLSTFSIDVDKASYSNVRRLINNGQSIPADAIKIEEMMNYFNYNYPQPQDEHPFSINTEVVTTPWNSETKLVKIGLQGKTYDNKELPASNLIFLIDVSGSMSSQNKLPLLKSAFKLLVNQLREKDKVSIVVYAGAAGVVLKPTSGKHKEKIILALNNLQSGGSTAGGEGIKLAYKIAEENFIKNGNNRVVMATDGDFNVGASSDKAMEELIEEKRKSGVFLSVLGFGYGNYKDSKLETLADKGNGNHAYIDTMQEAQKVFGKEFGGTLFTIAKDVKIQVEFNPKKVQAYRLIGYENRLLADEDFIDDTKDAGELGSGHTVTALYEVIPVGVNSDYLKDIHDLKYTKSEAAKEYSDELLTVKFRYKKPSGKKSIEMIHVQKDVITEASDDLNFLSSVALFGMQLRRSKYFNNATNKDVLALAKLGKGVDEEGYRAEFIRLVRSYQK